MKLFAVHATWIVSLVLSGCTLSRSATFGPVGRESQHRLGLEVAWGHGTPENEAAIASLLAKPLDLDAAVRIALARNQRLQAQFAELGIAASRISDATVLPPAAVDFDYKRAISGSGTETELTVVQDVLALVQIAQRRAAANAELDAARARAVSATVALAARVEVAFYDQLAARQDLELVQTAFDAASASAELTLRQHAAGNTTDLALAREREQRERLRVDVNRATQAVTDTRARLSALLGLEGGQRTWTTGGRLPDPPSKALPFDDLDRVAETTNLDTAALRAETDAAESRQRYAIVRAILPELGVGVAVARRDGRDWEAGPAIRIGIPLFDQQQGPRARARAEEQRARSELAATRTELAATVEATRSRAQQAFADVRQLADVVMPLQKQILDETVLQYNAMNASPFELLVARREMVEVGRQYIDALRRYWSVIAEIKALRRGGRAQFTAEEMR